MTDIVRFLEESRQAWRRLAWIFESGQRPLRIPGDSVEIVEDDAGDLFQVTYGVHGYPIAVQLWLGGRDNKWRANALRIVGDVRMTKRPVQSE